MHIAKKHLVAACLANVCIHLPAFAGSAEKILLTLTPLNFEATQASMTLPIEEGKEAEFFFTSKDTTQYWRYTLAWKSPQQAADNGKPESHQHTWSNRQRVPNYSVTFATSNDGKSWVSSSEYKLALSMNGDAKFSLDSHTGNTAYFMLRQQPDSK